MHRVDEYCTNIGIIFFLIAYLIKIPNFAIGTSHKTSNMEILDRMPFKAYKAAFEKLEKITDIAALSKEDRMKYDESIKVYRDIKATLAYSKKEGYDDGITKGREEGRKEGRITVARNMKSMGMASDVIIKATGLTIEDIENL